jgi:hypothetical protein
MKLKLIEGPASVWDCAGCGNSGMGGTEAFISAANPLVTLNPEEWYRSENTIDSKAYCAVCAVKLVEEDPTRSVSQFYSDTAGTAVEPENLPDI